MNIRSSHTFFDRRRSESYSTSSLVHDDVFATHFLPGQCNRSMPPSVAPTPKVSKIDSDSSNEDSEIIRHERYKNWCRIL